MEQINFSFDKSQLSTHSPQVVDAYQTFGIIKIQNFLSHKQLVSIQSELIQAEQAAEMDLQHYWNNKKFVFYSRNSQATPSINNDFISAPYFFNSADKVHVFYENRAGELRLNRLGHGLHLQTQYLNLQQLVYENETLCDLLRLVQFTKPICHLSVYIPKYPHGVGSEVRPHQEATFVHTQPQSVVVLWIALEDADIHNACMWGILGSNHWPLKYISHFDHSTKRRSFHSLAPVTIPDFTNAQDQFTPLPVKAGEALLFHGNFVHCSTANTSASSRKALSMQFIETENVAYLQSNWIKAPNQKVILS